MLGAVSWIEETARSVGLIGGGLLVLVGVFHKVPPFKQIVRYVWRRLVSEPLHESFKSAVKEANRDTIQLEVRRSANKAIGKAVPGAVQRSFDTKVSPLLDGLRRDLVEHMNMEDEAREREQAFREDVIDRLTENQRTTEAVEGRVESLEQMVLNRSEASLEGHVVLTPKVPESVAHNDTPEEGKR